MTTPSQRRRRKRVRKSARRAREKHAWRLRQVLDAAAPSLVRRAAQWPIRECRISADFRTTGIAHVLVARQEGRKVGAAHLLVDLGCLGVKGCFVHGALGLAEYRHLVREVELEGELVGCAPELAAKVVAAGVQHAESLGFRPAKLYALARELLAGIDPQACAEEIACGRGGMPFYVAGAEDDVGEILRRLDERAGPDGFRYLLPEVGFGDLRPAEDPEPSAEDPDPDARAHERLRRAENVVTRCVLTCALLRYGNDFLLRARMEYGRMQLAEPAAKLVFLRWALYLRPVPPDVLAERGRRLSELERRFLEQACRTPFSFHAVTAIDDRSFALRDLLTNRAAVVRDPRTQADLAEGCVLYARVVTLDGVSILVGHEPEALPAAVQEPLCLLREEVAGAGRFLDDDEVRRLDTELRFSYTLLLYGLRAQERWEGAPGETEEDEDLFPPWPRS